MDAGVIVGYLIAFPSGTAKQLAVPVVDDLLKPVYTKVAVKLRSDPAMRRLEDVPSDDRLKQRS